MARRGWGSLKTQRSGKIQASYVNPQDGVRYYALQTYDNKMDAEAWLAGEKRLIEMETWTPPQDRAKKAAASAITLEEYTRKWLVERDLADGTRDLYSGHAERRIYPVLGEVAVTEMTPALVRAWWAGMGRKHPTARRHAYNVLRAVMNTAVEDKLIAENP
ncbi:hypothetical protein, partial [Staphylococcus haemolyticus]